jgi:hypothetical protein
MKNTLTFNKRKELKAKPGEFPLKVLEEKLILDLLSKGYLPRTVTSGYYKIFKPYRLETIEYDYTTCCCCYVGKKQAGILWEKNKHILY